MNPPGDDLRDRPTSLIPRWLAALVLVALLGAAALSAWLVLTAELERAEPPIPIGTPGDQSGVPRTGRPAAV